MKRVLDYLRANVVAYLALFIALGGTSYALTVPAGSVGTRQLKNHSVTPIKLDKGKIAGYVRAWAVIQGGTQVLASRPQAKVLDWDPTSDTGDISWGGSISGGCIPLTDGGGVFVQAVVRPHFAGLPAVVHFATFTSSSQSGSNTAAVTAVVVLCPQP
jgi:hypothetical protein